MKSEYNIIQISIARDSINTKLTIIFQDDINIKLLECVIDPIQTQILDDSNKNGTTNQFIESIIKRSKDRYKIIEMKDINNYIYDITKLRDIKINQIIK